MVLGFNPALVRYQPGPNHHRLNELIGISTSPSPRCGLFLACRQPPATRTGQTRASLASQPHAPGSTKIQGFLGRDYRRARNGEARCTAMQNGLLVLCEGAHARSITTHPSALNCSIDICLPYARILLEIEGGSDAQPLLTCVAFGGRAHHTGL